MAWCLFGTRASAVTKMTLDVRCILGAPNISVHESKMNNVARKWLTFQVLTSLQKWSYFEQVKQPHTVQMSPAEPVIMITMESPSVHWALPGYTERPTSSWWLQTPWCQTGTKPSTTTALVFIETMVPYEWHYAIHIHWNWNVFILMKFSSLAALEVVKMTTSSAANDENFVKMTFSSLCMASQPLNTQ